jgi:leucyl-tRNA synthetase
LPKEELEKQGKNLPGVQKWLEGQTVVKVITVPDKLVNIVVK